MIRYDNVEYANSRLSDTVIRAGKDKDLFYVVRVRNDFTLEGNLVENNDYAVFRMEEADLSPLPLGYTNTVSGAFYVSRLPARRYKQGTYWGNTRLSGAVFNSGDRNYRVLIQPVKNLYPRVNEALALIEDGIPTVAVDRDICFDNYGRVVYKGHSTKPVGSYNRDNGNVTLNPASFYLREVFEEKLQGNLV